MLAVLDFWTRLVVYVDERPRAIGELRSHLCASRELSFRAQVLKRQDTIGESRRAIEWSTRCPHIFIDASG